MRRSITFVAVVVAVFCAGSGCATIAHSTGIGQAAGSDLVAINSKPPGATVHIDGVEIGVTPLTVKVSPQASTMTFAKDGYSAVTIPIPKDWNAWTIANVAWIPIAPFAAPGIVVDAVTGNIRKVRGTISATLPKAGE